jgi:DNA-binding IclR family transcriptional regulator
LSTTDLLKAAEPVLRELNQLCGFGVNLGIFDHGHITVVMRMLAKSRLRFDMQVGRMVPAHTSSMGKAFLSRLTDEELDSFYPTERLDQRTPKTIATKTALKAQLEEVRKTGVAYTRGEGDAGMEGIATLIRDVTGNPVAAISIHLPSFEANATRRKQLAMLVQKGASLVSYRLGYQGSEALVHDIRQIRTRWEESQSDSAR